MELTFQGLERYLYANYNGRATDDGLFLKLVEELGEIAELLNIRSGRKADQGENLQEELGKEIADAVHYLVAIAAINQIPLGDVILEKDKTAAQKYHHSINLEKFLENENR